MEPIKNSNPNYVMSMPQEQNYPTQEYDNYASVPAIYEPDMVEKRKASSNLLGMTAVGIVAAVTAGIIGHKMGGKGLSEAKAEAEEVAKKYENVLKENETLKSAKETLEKGKADADNALNEYRTMGRWKRFCSWLFPNSKISKTEAEARKAAREAKKEAGKVEEKVADGAKKESEKVTEKAEETGKKES